MIIRKVVAQSVWLLWTYEQSDGTLTQCCLMAAPWLPTTADSDKKKMDQSLIDDYFFIHKHQHGTSHWQFMVECGCSEGHLHHLWITNTAFMCASLHFTNLSFFVHTIFGFCSHVHLLQGSYTLFDEWEPWIIWHVVVCLPTVHWKIFFGHAKRIVTHYSSYLKNLLLTTLSKYLIAPL